MSNKDIHDQIEEIYGVKISPDMVTAITDIIIPTIQALEKSMYLSTQMITEKWTSRYPNWGVTLSELNIYFPDRILI